MILALVTALVSASAVTPDSSDALRAQATAGTVLGVASFGTPLPTAKSRLEALGYSCPSSESQYEVVQGDTLGGPLCHDITDSTWTVGLEGYDGLLTRIWVCHHDGKKTASCVTRGDGVIGRGFAPLPLWMAVSVALMSLVSIAAFLLVLRLRDEPAAIPAGVEEAITRSTAGEAYLRRAARWLPAHRLGQRRFILDRGMSWAVGMFVVFGALNLRDRPTLSTTRFITLQIMTAAVCCLGGLLVGWLVWRMGERGLMRSIAAQAGSPRAGDSAA